jgi:hypothetical protein
LLMLHCPDEVRFMLAIRHIQSAFACTLTTQGLYNHKPLSARLPIKP